MNADGGEDAGVLLRQADRVVVRLHAAAGADGDHACDARGLRARDHGVAVRGKALFVEVAVGIDQRDARRQRCIAGRLSSHEGAAGVSMRGNRTTGGWVRWPAAKCVPHASSAGKALVDSSPSRCWICALVSGSDHISSTCGRAQRFEQMVQDRADARPLCGILGQRERCGDHDVLVGVIDGAPQRFQRAVERELLGEAWHLAVGLGKRRDQLLGPPPSAAPSGWTTPSKYRCCIDSVRLTRLPRLLARSALTRVTKASSLKSASCPNAISRSRK